jgi:hypothetical protein
MITLKGLTFERVDDAGNVSITDNANLVSYSPDEWAEIVTTLTAGGSTVQRRATFLNIHNSGRRRTINDVLSELRADPSKTEDVRIIEDMLQQRQQVTP